MLKLRCGLHFLHILHVPRIVKSKLVGKPFSPDESASITCCSIYRQTLLSRGPRSWPEPCTLHHQRLRRTEYVWPSSYSNFSAIGRCEALRRLSSFQKLCTSALPSSANPPYQTTKYNSIIKQQHEISLLLVNEEGRVFVVASRTSY